MKTAILGTGDVGRSLAAGFARHGHEVRVASRTPDSGKLDDWLAKHPGVALAGHAEAAGWAELIVICTPWGGTENALRLAGAANCAGKVVIDVTNPLGPPAGGAGGAGARGAPVLVVSGDDSAGEQVQRWLPDARVVKCWNSVGNAHMIDPDFPDGPPTMFIAGNDPDAKKVVRGLLESFGWDAADSGGIEASRYLEPLAMVWILDFFATGSGNMAFRMIRK